MLLFINKKRSVIMSLFLIGVLLGCSLSSVRASSLSDITSESIEQKKEEINQAEQQQENLKESIDDLKNTIDDLEDKKDDLEEYITEIDSTVGDIEGRIYMYQNQVTEKEAEITIKEQELADALLKEEQQYSEMSIHVQYMYEFGQQTQLEILLTATSFSDFLNRAEYVSALSAYDSIVLEAFILNREYVELTKQSLEADKVVLNDIKQAAEAEKQQMEAIKAAKQLEVAKYESDIAITDAIVKENEEALEYQTSLIAQLEDDIDNERKEIAKENGMDLGYNGGTFAMPYPNYVRVSSDFGWRTDPFTGLSAYHSGVDFAGPEGDAIVAAYDGVVAKAEYNSSMGNYVMIDHGDNLYTIYMHASKLYVSQNEVVTKGETIAAVGTTGRSTGPHLHFGVRLDGAYVSPWDYLK